MKRNTKSQVKGNPFLVIWKKGYSALCPKQIKEIANARAKALLAMHTLVVLLFVFVLVCMSFTSLLSCTLWHTKWLLFQISSIPAEQKIILHTNQSVHFYLNIYFRCTNSHPAIFQLWNPLPYHCFILWKSR